MPVKERLESQDVFGFLTPKSFENKVMAGEFQDIRIKDCGQNNVVIGGQLVDNSQDPCN